MKMLSFSWWYLIPTLIVWSFVFCSLPLLFIFVKLSDWLFDDDSYGIAAGLLITGGLLIYFVPVIGLICSIAIVLTYFNQHICIFGDLIPSCKFGLKCLYSKIRKRKRIRIGLNECSIRMVTANIKGIRIEPMGNRFFQRLEKWR